MGPARRPSQWLVAGVMGLGTMSTAHLARANDLVADCAPATVLAAAPTSRKAILARAKTFHDLAPDYQQANCMNFFTGEVVPREGSCTAPTWWRTDCSGFVSAAWNLTSSYTTGSLGRGGSDESITWQEKSWDELVPGDAINLPGDHTMIFTGWLDVDQSTFCVMEEIHVGYTDPWGGLGCIADARDVDSLQAQGFVPIGLDLDGTDAGAPDSGPSDGGDDDDGGDQFRIAANSPIANTSERYVVGGGCSAAPVLSGAPIGGAVVFVLFAFARRLRREG